MDNSLCVLLPVFNAQQSLSRRVMGLLEELPDLADRFELVIVDDGSSDATIEIGDELAQQYPQVRVVRHGLHQGRSAAIEAGLLDTTADVVLVQEEDEHLTAASLRSVASPATISPPPRGSLSPPPLLPARLLHKLQTWGVRLQQPPLHPATVTPPTTTFASHLRNLAKSGQSLADH